MQPQPDDPRQAGGFPIPPGVQAQMATSAPAPPHPDSIGAPTDAPEGAITALDYIGAMAPIEGQVLWKGHLHRFLFRITTGDDELRILAHRNQFASKEEKDIAESQYRLACAIVAVNGQEVRFPTLEAKLAWVKKWPSTYADAVLSAYQIVAWEPTRLEAEMLADPNIETGPADSGASGSHAAASGLET